MTDSRPAVVLMHGWPVTRLHWRRLAPALADAGFAVVELDLPGLGAPVPPELPDLAKQSLAEWMHDALRRRGLARYAVIGHDWGGTVGTLLAATGPDTVNALVIEEEILPGVDVAIPAPGSDHYPSWHGPFNRAAGLAESLVPGRERAYYGGFLAQSAGPHPLDPQIVDEYVAAYVGEERLAASLSYYRTAEVDARAVRRIADDPIRTPVLALGGEFGMGSAVEEGMRGLASDVTGRVLPGAGHYPAEQNPAAVIDAVIPFLSAHAD
ncbi:alpha/beta fold hydrolase [Microbacterium barkeri]|uniref:alpha/beta fold hydrolase n=1 Tax=Microbacterium barkeri TaxID=33917 RepID=UPI0024AFE6F2|nr:alpha/beta fold hydrolase [Microbacterium barkeri]MDI6943644.1 alpha/beta fold hydrolase [Microbacterium barkeri]